MSVRVVRTRSGDDVICDLFEVTTKDDTEKPVAFQLVNAYYWDESNSKIFYFSTVWIVFEFLRSILFTGLPWNLIGYSWSWSLKYSQIVSVLGVYGLGFLTVFCSVSIFSIFIN